MPGSKHDTPALGYANACRRTTMKRIRTAAHFDKDMGAIRFAHDQIDFAATAARRPIIARYQPQAGTLQIAQGVFFRGIPALFGGLRMRRF